MTPTKGKMKPIRAWAVFQRYKNTFQSAHPNKFEAEVSIYDEVRANYILKEVEIRQVNNPPTKRK